MTQTRLLMFIAAIIMSVAGPLAAQRAPRRDPRAVTAMEEAVRPKTAAAAAIRDSVAEGTVQMANGQTGTIRIVTQGSARVRHEIILPTRTLVSVFKDGKGSYLAGNKKKEFPAWVAAHQSVDHIPLLSRLASFDRNGIKLIEMGTRTFAGRLCQQVRLSVQAENDREAAIEDLVSELHIFIDAETKQIAGTRAFLFSPEAIENRSPVDRVYGDYRLVDGIPVPFRIDEYISGKLDRVITWTSVRLNVGIADTLFEAQESQ